MPTKAEIERLQAIKQGCKQAGFKTLFQKFALQMFYEKGNAFKALTHIHTH